PGRLFVRPAWSQRLAPRSWGSLASSPERAASRSPTTTGPCTRLPAMVGPTRRTDRASLVSAESGSWPRRDCSRKQATNTGGRSNETSAHDPFLAVRACGLWHCGDQLRRWLGSELTVRVSNRLRG